MRLIARDWLNTRRSAPIDSIGNSYLKSTAPPAFSFTLSGPHESKGEAIGLALDRGIEHLDRVRVVLVREQGAFRVQYEAGRLRLRADGGRIDPMQRLGIARARPGCGGVV